MLKNPSQSIVSLTIALTLLMTPLSELAAESTKSAKKQLANYQASLAAMRNQEDVYIAEIQQLRIDIATLENLESPERAELETAKLAQEQANVQYTQDASEANKAQLDNVNFKYFLAERKYKKAHNQVSVKQAALRKLEINLSASRDVSVNIDKKIQKQRKRIIRLLELRLAAQKKKTSTTKTELLSTQSKLEEEMLATKARTAEIQRLNALIAEQQQVIFDQNREILRLGGQQ